MPEAPQTSVADLQKLRIPRPDEAVRGSGGPGAAPRRRRRGVVPVVLLALVGGALFLVWPRLQPWLLNMRAVPVKVGVVIKTRPGASAELTTASGYIVARTRAALSSKLAGELVELKVDAGSRVKAGDVLARLNDSLYRSALRQAQADETMALAEEAAAAVRVQIAQKGVDKTIHDADEMKAAMAETRVEIAEAERVVKREQDMLAKDASTKESLAIATYKRDLLLAGMVRAETRLKTTESTTASAVAEVKGQEARITVATEATRRAHAMVETATTNLRDTEIRAPFAGVVLKKEAEVGEMVVPALMGGGGSARGAVVTLADFSTLEMEVDVFERDLHHIREGAPARIVLDSYSDEPFPAHVRQIQPTGDRVKSTVLVKVSLDASDPRILPEMGGRVIFLRDGVTSVPAPEVLAPPSALVTRNGQKGVFELRANIAVFVPVAVGETKKTGVVITSGLTGGETVLTSPPPGVEDGTIVKKEDPDG